jgi:hypothetical protein
MAGFLQRYLTLCCSNALDEADLKKARARLRSGEYSKVRVADELEVSRHTLWRALSLGGRRLDKPSSTAGAGTTTLPVPLTSTLRD